MISCKGSIFLGGLAAIVALPVLCQAAVKGACSTCHTMHNSEQGAAVAFSLDSAGAQVASDTPYAKLLRTDCIGCHTNAGAETIVEMENTRVPVVFNLSEPTYPPDGSMTSTLAGGNFHWLALDGDPYGHNVYGIAAIDARYLHDVAPGGNSYSGECTNCHGTLATAESGCNGCHVPLHHTDAPGIVTDRRKGWYRFLGSVMQDTGLPEPPPEGVVGIESRDWEQSPAASQHNTYQGKPGPFISYLESGSISQKCAGCHGLFHNNSIAGATWIRHPVDATIPDAGEFTDLVIYDPLVPVARQNVKAEDDGFAMINRGSDMVSCISCHRAHGSPYPAMLRWGYRDWPGIDSHTGLPAENGCAVCHTTKD